MPLKINIALRLPNASHPDRYFSFRLQAGIQVPPPCVYKDASKLFVVSDIKDHFRPFHKLLIKHRVIDRHFQWTFDEGHLVVLGNSFDSKELTTEYLWFLYDIEQKAKMQGGHVHFIPGSHEILHINGKWRREHPPYPSPTSKLRSPMTALYDANFEIGRWLGTRNLVERIGHLLFIHGDIFPILTLGNNTIAEMNSFARQAYPKLPEVPTDKLPGSFFSGDGDFLQCLHNDTLTEENKVSTWLKAFNSDSIIMSQAKQERISVTLDGKLIRVTTQHEKDNPTGLFINHGKLLQVDRQGRREKINL